MQQIKNEKTNYSDFITQGIYQPYATTNYIYNIQDFTPLIINNQPKIIGEGRFSTVYLYKHKFNGRLFALKKISINKIIESGNDTSIIQREINIHSRIHHENIVQFYSFNQGLNEVNILLEYCPNGSIFELIDKNGFDEIKTYKYFSQVVNAVYFLHKNNLVHRDIKPENILLNGDKIKLCDFGWCCETNYNNRKSFCGTFEYMAPEIIKEMPYGKPVDIWALGILLYELYFGVSPFNSYKENEEQTKEIINNIMQKRLYFNRKNIPYDMKDLIIHMLEFDVVRRYTIEEIVAHPWFKKCREKIQNNNFNLNNYNQINNYDNLETNVTKVTKISKNQTQLSSSPQNILFRTRRFMNERNNYNQEHDYERPNKYKYYSNKSLNFKNLKYYNPNNSEILFPKDGEEDGFSPYMKNGSINISLSLKNNKREFTDKKIKIPTDNNFKDNYSNKKRKIYKTKSLMNSNEFKTFNFFPMDNLTQENIKINKIPIKQSNFQDKSRISVVKLNNINSDFIPQNTNVIDNKFIPNNSFSIGNNVNRNIINYNFYQIHNNNQFNNIFY